MEKDSCPEGRSGPKGTHPRGGGGGGVGAACAAQNFLTRAQSFPLLFRDDCPCSIAHSSLGNGPAPHAARREPAVRMRPVGASLRVSGDLAPRPVGRRRPGGAQVAARRMPPLRQCGSLGQPSAGRRLPGTPAPSWQPTTRHYTSSGRGVGVGALALGHEPLPCRTAVELWLTGPAPAVNARLTPPSVPRSVLGPAVEVTGTKSIAHSLSEGAGPSSSTEQTLRVASEQSRQFRALHAGRPQLPPSQA